MKRTGMCLVVITLLFVNIANAQTKSMTGTVIDSPRGMYKWAAIVIQVGHKKYFVYTECGLSEGYCNPKIIGNVGEVGRTVQVFYTKIVNSQGYDGEVQATKLVEVRAAARSITPRGAGNAQTTPNESWNAFWAQFSAAVNKKDRVALKRLMASEREFHPGSLGSREGWLQAVEKQRWWGLLQKSVRLGTVPFDWSGEPTRVTRDNHLGFRFLRGRWRFLGPWGD
jgi:hypothetical protein